MPPRLMLWDFVVRGNDALSLTTSFFITERTLYLLVFKLTDCTALRSVIKAESKCFCRVRSAARVLAKFDRRARGQQSKGTGVPHWHARGPLQPRNH